MDAIQLFHLSKRYGSHQAVKNLSLSIRSGSFYALLGANGAGKTTTLRMIAGLLQPDNGDVIINGHSIKRSPQKAKQLLAYLHQNNQVDNTCTHHDTPDSRVRSLKDRVSHL